MINIKKIILFIILTCLYIPETNAAIKDSLFASVGNKALTKSDILAELKVILILNGQSFSENKRKQLESAAISSCVKRKIKEIEIGKYGNLTFSKVDLEKELSRLANNLNMDLDMLRNTLLANDIDFSYLINRITIELLWNSLIFSLYKDRITINIEEIDEKLKIFQEEKKIYEYLISEIIIKDITKDELESKIEEIKNRIKNEGFEKVAMDISISESALNGGDLGWISENTISKKFRSEIINTVIGNTSQPIILPAGVLLLKVRNKRELKKFKNLEEAKNQFVDDEKAKILNMHSLSHYDNLKRSITIQYY